MCANINSFKNEKKRNYVSNFRNTDKLCYRTDILWSEKEMEKKKAFF